jgi:hypothetical protein
LKKAVSASRLLLLEGEVERLPVEEPGGVRPTLGPSKLTTPAMVDKLLQELVLARLYTMHTWKSVSKK